MFHHRENSLIPGKNFLFNFHLKFAFHNLLKYNWLETFKKINQIEMKHRKSFRLIFSGRFKSKTELNKEPSRGKQDLLCEIFSLHLSQEKKVDHSLQTDSSHYSFLGNLLTSFL